MSLFRNKSDRHNNRFCSEQLRQTTAFGTNRQTHIIDFVSEQVETIIIELVPEQIRQTNLDLDLVFEQVETTIIEQLNKYKP